MFSDPKVLKRLKELNVLLVKADKGNLDVQDAINADLLRYGRKTIPTNIIGPSNPDVPAIILPEYLNAERALEALNQAEAMSK